MTSLTTPNAAPSTPAVRDAQLAERLARTCGLKLAERPVVMTGEPDLMVVPMGQSTVNLSSATALLRCELEPADQDTLEQALSALEVQVAKRQNDEGYEDLQLAVYAARLRQFPADVALRALDEWPRRFGNKFWPTWSELEADLNRMTRWRRAALAALAFAAKDQPDDKVEKTDEVANGLRNLAAKLSASAPGKSAQAKPKTAERDRVQTQRPKRSVEEQMAALAAAPELLPSRAREEGA